MKTLTFDDVLKEARRIMRDACLAAAKDLNESPPSIREEIIPEGVRLVAVWPDGEETNECIVKRLNPNGEDVVIE